MNFGQKTAVSLMAIIILVIMYKLNPILPAMMFAGVVIGWWLTE
jgi:hypothetical protein